MSSAELPKPKEDQFYEFKPFRVPKYKIKFEQAYKLADVAGYVWYTPAMLYVWGRYTETNLGDLVRQRNIRVFWYLFDKPIFSGFTVGSDSSWNHILWAVSEDQWNSLVDGFLETVQFDIPNKRLYQYALQQLTVPDPLTFDQQRILVANHPLQKVHAFAVLSNERQIAFDTRKSGVVQCPQVSSFKPDKIHVQAADQLFSIPGLNQDRAFSAYKEILMSTQDNEYQQKVDQRKRK